MRRLVAPVAALALAAGGCNVKTEGAPCTDDTQCPTGQVCWTNSRTCRACPAAGSALGQGCALGSPESCAGTVVASCDSVASSCGVWTLQKDCGAAGLTCKGPTADCACADNSSSTFYADSTVDRSSFPAIRPTGLLTPAICRYATLAAAITEAKGPGATVRATGHVPGGLAVVFTEGTLSIPTGVTVTTDESAPATGHYVIKPDASVTTGPFISLAPGTALGGFELGNNGATGDAITTNCLTAPPVTIDTVSVNGTGASLAKFKTGIHHSGICSLSVSNTTITGVGDTGIVLDGGGPSVSLTNNVITGNDATRQYTFPGPIVRQGGGIVVSSSVPSSVVFHGNQVYGNKGDQIVVAVGSGTLDLRGGASIGDCPATSNVIRCYDMAAGGKGIYAAATPLEVMADFNEWPTTFPGVPDVSGNVTGIGSWCPVQSRPACP